MPPPDVVCVKVADLRRKGYASLEHWKSASDAHVYIGRNVRYVAGADGSIWQNPFAVKKYGLQESLRMYESRVRSISDLWDALRALEGKTLGCWCCDGYPSPSNEKTELCHGHVLRRLFIERYV